MYNLYVETFKNNILDTIGEEMHPCKFITDSPDEFENSEYALLTHMQDSDTSAAITVDMTFNYIQDYKVTKYFTEDTTGKIEFWDYDFIRFFPTLVKPSVILIARDESLLSQLENLIMKEYADPHLAKSPHPILPDQQISIKLSISNGKNLKHFYNPYKNVYGSTIFFDIVTLPWYFCEWDKTDVEQRHIVQKEVLRQYFALCHLEENCANLINSTAGNTEADTYRLTSITSRKAELLDILNIDKELRDFESVNKIAETVNQTDMSIQEAIKRLQAEMRAKQRREELSMERERVQAYAPQDDSDTQGGSILGAAISAFSEYRKERKIEERNARREREQREYERKEYVKRQNEERRRQAIQSQREWEAVRKANEERRRKGQPLLPLPPRKWY